MTLREYLNDVLPAMTDVQLRTRQRYVRAVESFYVWLGREIDLVDVSPAMIQRFRGVDSLGAGGIRAIMSTHDPVRFRRDRRVAAKPRKQLPSQASAYLGAVYANRYEPTALRSRRPNTKRLYRTTLAMFDTFLGHDATLDDLNDDTVARFASWRIEKGLSKHSVNKDLFNLLAIWRWCNRKGLVANWPDVQMEIPPRRQPVAWTEKEMRKLYRTASELDGKVGKLHEGDWWAALLLVAWDSGERIRAIVNLDWSNVDLRRGWIRFLAEDRKGGRDDSAVRLSQETVGALRKIRSREGSVFPWPYSPTYLWSALTRILKLAGLPTDAKSKFHRIRKTVASYAEAAGGNATAMLRHSKREITQAYLDPRVVKQQQPSDVLFRLTT